MKRHGRWMAAVAAGGWLGLALFAPRAEASVVHVATNGLSVAPYANWENAATNIQTAVDYAATNGITVVQLTNHTYTIPGQIFVTNAVTVRGSSREETIVRRATTGDTDPRHRIFYVNHADAVVESLTAQHGNAKGGFGGGIYLIKGLVHDCDIANSRGNVGNQGIGVYLAGSGAVLSNCVVRSCSGEQSSDLGAGVYIAAGALVTHCVLRNNSNARGVGAGAYVNGGTLRWSTVRNNTIIHNNGVGVYVANNAASLVEYCEVRDNTTSWWGDGVGIYMAGQGTVRNCLVTGNRNLEYAGTARGGGLYINANSVVENCTVVNNYSLTEGGGIYATGGTIRNCIIDSNYSPLSPNARTNAGTYVTCLLPGGAPGDNIDGSPTFTDAASRDYRLTLLSLGLNAGTDQGWMDAPAVDLAGGPRKLLGRSDIGAYETADTFACAFNASPALGLAPLTVHFTATVVGTNTSSLTYFWDFDGNGSWDDSGSDKQTTSREYALGEYRPVLWVTNGVGESAIYTGQTAIVASGLTLYVATRGTHTAPFETWGKAATNVQAAIDAAATGARVVISNGTYTLGAQIVLDKAITVESVNGRAVTKLRCASRSYRVLKLSNAGAVVRGLTLDNGLAYELEGGVAPVRRGGGAYIVAGTLDDCVITGCFGDYAQGAGFYLASGLVTNCVVQGNSQRGIGSGVRGIGGFVAGGEVVDCRFSGNTISANVSDNNWGGGLHVAGGTVRSCVFSGNSLGTGRGAGLSMAGGLVDRCIVTNNVTQYSTLGGRGGGAYVGGGTLRNTLVMGNRSNRSATLAGGGIYQTGGLIENCTVVTNRATHASGTVGGLYATAGATTNSIFAYNMAQGGTVPDDVLVTAPATIGFSRARELTPGVGGNITADPLFLAPTSGGYSLAPDSPCVNAGMDMPWIWGSLDLAGNPRRAGRVDMGAYEAILPKGTMIMIR